MMKIVLCGSMKFEPEMQKLSRILEKLGFETAMPSSVEGHAHGQGVSLDTIATLKRGFIDEHFRKIDDADAILVVNHEKHGVEGYVGGNTLMEIAYAYAQGLEVFMLHPIPEIRYRDEIQAMMPIIIDGDVAKIVQYVDELPLLLASTESSVKHRALSRGLRRAGIRTRVKGIAAQSQVSEQPRSIEESYEGAMNRHAFLAAQAKDTAATYLATVESGLHVPHHDLNEFGCAVIILESIGKQTKIGIDLDVEIPRAMTDKVPSQYADIGTLVQQEYGSQLKDPYPFFTNHKLTRVKLLENAIYNLAVQL